MEASPLELERRNFQPRVPHILQNLREVGWVEQGSPTTLLPKEQLESLFPHLLGHSTVTLKKGAASSVAPCRIGAVFSGGQAAGGHNILTGLFDALPQGSTLLGFLGGPSGIIANKTLTLTADILARYRNMGGFDLLGSGRTKIETPEQFQSALTTVKALNLDGLVVIGGDDSNTNAALLAEYFLANRCKTVVIGVPKTIDGDLRNSAVALSFGFDTAARTYAELIGNIARDALSAKKYTHFIRLMGRSASHLTLECALMTHPNITLIGEEVFAKKQTLGEIVEEIAGVILRRSQMGKDYGVILLPEGIIEFIPEIRTLIAEINLNLAEGKKVPESLSLQAQKTFVQLPSKIAHQLLLDRDPHGNVQVSHIASEELLLTLVSEKVKFSPVAHFFGYEGRSALPTNFDANYCYALGLIASTLVFAKKTGYMCAVGNLSASPLEWHASAVPLVGLIVMEERKGKKKPVIQKALVDLKGVPFQAFLGRREEWALSDSYVFPGPIQFFGPNILCDEPPIGLRLEQRVLTP